MRSRTLNVLIVTPAPRRSRKGNRVTALRWAGMLRRLRHRVRISETLVRGDWDCLVALHARKSHEALVQFQAQYPKRLSVVALTGTDLYEDIHHDCRAQESLQLADRLIVLQDHGVSDLPEEHQAKARVIYQSVAPPVNPPPKREDRFDVCVVGHLRDVKDPMLAAGAAQCLPADSKVHIVLIGGALDKKYVEIARTEQANNARFEWLGELSRRETLRTIAQSELLALTSLMEGGANVIGEALVCGTPVVSTRIAGSIGLLGADYLGFFPVGDHLALADLLLRTEAEPEFLGQLAKQCEAKRFRFDQSEECKRWRELLCEFYPQ